MYIARMKREGEKEREREKGRWKITADDIVENLISHPPLRSLL